MGANGLGLHIHLCSVPAQACQGETSTFILHENLSALFVASDIKSPGKCSLQLQWYQVICVYLEDNTNQSIVVFPQQCLTLMTAMYVILQFKHNVELTWQQH
jgi:hypothetical protein